MAAARTVSREVPAPAVNDSRILRSLAVASAVVVVGWGIAVLRAPAGSRPTDLLVVELDIASSVLAIVGGTLLIARYRLVRDRPTLYVGAGFVALGAARGAGRLLLTLLDVQLSRSNIAMSVRLAGWVVGLGALSAAIVGLQTVRRPMWVLAGALPIGAVLIALVASLPPETPVEELTFTSTAQVVLTGLLSVLWLVLAAVYLRSGLRARTDLVAWLGLSFAFLGVAQVLAIPAALVPGLPVASAAVLRTEGYLCALFGIMSEVRQVYLAQAGRLREATVTAESLEERLRSEVTSSEVRAHQARNAIQAVDGAIHVLERFGGELSSGEREELNSLVRQGIESLQSLLEPSPKGPPPPE
jgi:hypothetical protein